MIKCRFAQITDSHWRQAIPGTSGCHNRKSRLIPLALKDALEKIKKDGVEVVVLTGDLLDVPDGELSPEMLNFVKQDYRSLKSILDNSELKYIVIPGNHDNVNLLYSVFEKKRKLEHAGFEFIAFFDFEIWGTDVYRKDDELAQFITECESAGSRNQIHLQHYLIYDEHKNSLNPYLKNDDENISEDKIKGFKRSLNAHAYANSDKILDTISNSPRVKLTLSGHYHQGSKLDKIGETHYYVSPSFSEKYFTYSMIDLYEDRVDIQLNDLEENFLTSPLSSPYIQYGNWHKGGLHIHCSENSRCATIPLEPTIEMYKKQKFNFIAVTDHDKITSVDNLKKNNPDMVFYEGFEHSVTNHMLFIAEKVKPLYEIKDKRDALLQAKNDLTIVCHPEGPKKGYWTVDELKKTYPSLPTGVEVFNGHYGVGGWRKAGGGWDYTQFWENCLDADMRFFAYANDDYHDGSVDLANAWNMVLAEEKTSPSIFKALKQGSCYASTGIMIQSIHEYKGTIIINLNEEVDGTFFGPNHTVLLAKKSQTFELSYEGQKYIRFEAESNGRKCWTQPMYSK